MAMFDKAKKAQRKERLKDFWTTLTQAQPAEAFGSDGKTQKVVVMISVILNSYKWVTHRHLTGYSDL